MGTHMLPDACIPAFTRTDMLKGIQVFILSVTVTLLGTHSHVTTFTLILTDVKSRLIGKYLDARKD